MVAIVIRQVEAPTIVRVHGIAMEVIARIAKLRIVHHRELLQTHIVKRFKIIELIKF